MLNLKDLDAKTRPFMLSEVEYDVQRGTLYYSPRLSQKGRADFPDLLRQAVNEFHDQWLADQLEGFGRFLEWEMATRRGRRYRKRIPADEKETLAEGEFN